MERAVYIKASGACECMNVRVKIQDFSGRMNPGNHPGNKSDSIESSLEAFFHRLPGTPEKLGIQRVIKPEIDAQHLRNGKGAAYYRDSGNNLLNHPFPRIKRSPLRTRRAKAVCLAGECQDQRVAAAVAADSREAIM